MSIIIKLDYTLESPEERKELVEQILKETPNPSPKYLEILADYLILCMEKQERKEKKILTENRLATVNKRETSFEGLASQLENGEDGIYNLMSNDKHMIFQPKISITKKDLEEVPFLKQLRGSIEIWENKLSKATGKEAYIIKKTLIELRKDQYVIKNAYRRPIVPLKLIHSKPVVHLDEEIFIDSKGTINYSGGSLLDQDIISIILCNYSRLKEESCHSFENDTWYMLYDFDKMRETALKDYPLYQCIVECKINGFQNVEIQQMLQDKFNCSHSVEYISSLWRNKIPQLIASAAEDSWLNWYYLNKEPGKWKKCSRCGQVKLAHNKYFSKNGTSKDGFYSICKCCRNKKKEK